MIMHLEWQWCFFHLGMLFLLKAKRQFTSRDKRTFPVQGGWGISDMAGGTHPSGLNVFCVWQSCRVFRIQRSLPEQYSELDSSCCTPFMFWDMAGGTHPSGLNVFCAWILAPRGILAFHVCARRNQKYQSFLLRFLPKVPFLPCHPWRVTAHPELLTAYQVVAARGFLALAAFLRSHYRLW